MSALRTLRRRLLPLCLLSLAGVVDAATLPAGFTETRVASGLASPTAMAFAPDGRLFVTQQGGAVRVIKNGALLTQPFLSLSVDFTGERGLLGIAFDPNFASNRFVYVYYTTSTSPIHNRVSRFTASASNPDVVAAGSEVQLLNLPTLSSATNHNGGAIHFGTDGKLYIAVGDNANGSNSQSLNNTLGKVLRINPDGSIPSDNPFLNQTSGTNQAIWAMGLRNPFNFAVDRTNGRIHVNDVGQDSWEEVNLGVAGSNYGWPQTEGNNPPGVAGVRYPIYTYQNAGSNCAITAAAFYRPETVAFPAEYAGRFFFGDFCGGFIRMLSPPNYSTPMDFATGIDSLVDIQVSADGSLYYLARGGGEVFRVQSTSNTVVFSDDFESARGWTLTGGANTAVSGLWQRGDPQATSSNGLILQPNNCDGPSVNCFVTGLTAGSAYGSNDVDGGQTSVQSPPIALPSTGTLVLTFRFYLAHRTSATSADYFRVRVVGNDGVPQTVYTRVASSQDKGGVWMTRTVNLGAWAGQTIQLRFDALDNASASLIEAGFDNVSITRQ